MKRIFLNPLAVAAVASSFMFGCTSTEETGTAVETSPTVTESVTTDLGGLDVMVIEESVTVPVATLSITALPMENTVEIDEMYDDIDDTEKFDVVSLARKSPNLTTFVKLLEQANLIDDLERVEKVTLFAPTNEAFSKMPREKLEDLLRVDNIAMLARMLQLHVMAQDVSSLRLRDNDRIRITEDSYLPINVPTVGNVMVGGAQLVGTDIEASNGRIHVLDAVITRDAIREEGLR